jgi:transposase InsO family protein
MDVPLLQRTFQAAVDGNPSLVHDFYFEHLFRDHPELHGGPQALFPADKPEDLALNACWAGDITYVRTWEGWMYLATVIDLASRRVVGWAMADHMRADLVCEALEMALSWRRPGPGLVFHSDRGSQYTSRQFRELLAAHGVSQSLSRPRQAAVGIPRRRTLPDALGIDFHPKANRRPSAHKLEGPKRGAS